METVAVIPIRRDSQGIPGKHTRILKRKWMMDWVLEAAVNAQSVDRVIVATNDDAIRWHVERKYPCGAGNVSVFQRSEESAADDARSEDVLCEVCEAIEFDTLAFLQATNPQTTPDDIDGAVSLLESGSVVSVVRQHKFYYSEHGGELESLNGGQIKPLRQNWSGVLQENGAVYVLKAADLLKFGTRYVPPIRGFEMHPSSQFEIDEPVDFELVDWAMNNRELWDIRGTKWSYIDEIERLR